MKNLLKLFTTLILFFAVSVPCFAKNESVTIISDICLSSDKSENKMTPSIRRLINAVNQANADTSDSVVFLGNNVSSANKYDTAMFAKIIKRLNKPYYVLVGNRDVNRTKYIDKKEFYRIVNKYSSNRLKTTPSYKKQGDLVFVFMSGVNETFSTYKGYYKDKELDFLNDTLSKFKDNKVIIFQHFPVVSAFEDDARKTVKLENYLEVLNRHNNVLAVISGHMNKEEIADDENGVKHINVGALSKGEYEQIKIFKNKDNTYTITAKIYNAE